MAEAVKKHPAKKHPTKGVSARKGILCYMLLEGKELNEFENKADQILDRVILSKSSATSKGNTDFSKLIELKERYKKDDPFWIYKFNHQDFNNQSTYIFKTSKVSVDIGNKLDRVGDHYLSSSYVHFDRNNKRVNIKTFYIILINKKANNIGNIQLRRKNKENTELFGDIKRKH